jgi:hypothetical protein
VCLRGPLQGQLSVGCIVRKEEEDEGEERIIPIVFEVDNTEIRNEVSFLQSTLNV